MPAAPALGGSYGGSSQSHTPWRVCICNLTFLVSNIFLTLDTHNTLMVPTDTKQQTLQPPLQRAHSRGERAAGGGGRGAPVLSYRAGPFKAHQGQGGLQQKCR